MGQTVNDRVAETIQKALNETHHTPTTLSEDIGVSRNSIYSWRDKKTKNIGEDNLKKIANALPVNLEWLKTGKGIASDDPALNEIKRRVTEKDETYKGLDQTLSNVESKASTLKQDLQDLLDEIDKLRGDD